MSDIIKLLPDSIANQIAAGEVIQRPASVIKELTENAIDSGAMSIGIVVKDAGRTLIQVIDNGCGMSPSDARMCFERHATSKIRKSDDLFAIRTMGFRGEALASIAAVAQVELRTRRFEDQLGTAIHIEDSKVTLQEPVSCQTGSNFLIKNLFYNVPARRKFLKSNNVEFRHIINEFCRVALTNNNVAMTLIHNDEEIYNLPAANLKQRIVGVFGKNISQNLIPVKTETSLVNISGFIGKPEFSKKSSGDQYFFVNNRFMKNPYFYRAVMKAYENLIPGDMFPSFFIYLETDPKSIDINIHPTKTEIKFEDENAIWQIIHVTVKEALGKFNVVPSLDFEQDAAFNVPVLKKGEDIKQPTITVNPDYNPFKSDSSPGTGYRERIKQESVKYWENMYEGLKSGTPVQSTLPVPEPVTAEKAENPGSFFQFKGRYILTSVKSGLMVIDQKRAHERILFEEFMGVINTKSLISQKTLFPETLQLSAPDYETMKEIKDDLHKLGWEIGMKEKNTIEILGVPGYHQFENPAQNIEKFLEAYQTSSPDFNEKAVEKIALSLAKSTSVQYDVTLSFTEMNNLFDRLFACSNPNYTADGKKVISIIPTDEIIKKMNNFAKNTDDEQF